MNVLRPKGCVHCGGDLVQEPLVCHDPTEQGEAWPERVWCLQCGREVRGEEVMVRMEDQEMKAR